MKYEFFFFDAEIFQIKQKGRNFTMFFFFEIEAKIKFFFLNCLEKYVQFFVTFQPIFISEH